MEVATLVCSCFPIYLGQAGVYLFIFDIFQVTRAIRFTKLGIGPQIFAGPPEFTFSNDFPQIFNVYHL